MMTLLFGSSEPADPMSREEILRRAENTKVDSSCWPAWYDRTESEYGKRSEYNNYKSNSAADAAFVAALKTEELLLQQKLDDKRKFDENPAKWREEEKALSRCKCTLL